MSSNSSVRINNSNGCTPERNSIRRIHRSQQTEPIDHFDSFSQTDLRIQDKYSLPPGELIKLAYQNWYRQVMDVKVHCIKGTRQKFFDLNCIRQYFPDKFAFDSMSLCFIHRFHDIFYQYSHQISRRDGVIDNTDIFFDLHGVNMGAIVDLFKSYSPYFNSTIPNTYTQWCQKPSAVKIDIIRELKFYRFYTNGLPLANIEKFDITYYYMFLQSQKIPITELLANNKVIAQCGMEAQVGFELNCPQLAEITAILDRLTKSIEHLCSPDVLDLLKAKMSALLTSIWNLIRWSMNKLSTLDLIVNLIGSFTSLYPSENVAKLFGSLFNNVTAQSGLDISLPTAVKGVFVCLFLVVCSKLPRAQDIDSFVRRVKDIPMALKSIGTFWEQVGPVTNECIAFLEEHICGYDTSASRIRTIDEVTKFSERVAELTDLHKRRQINKDPVTSKDAGRLHYDAVRLLGKCVNMNYDRKSIEFLRSLLPTTYKISESALASGADMNKIRRKPIVIWLAGMSQIGKTTLIMKLIQDIEKHSSSHFREHGELPEDWQKEIYTCCPENEYMDGYHGQNWVTMDEFNQLRDSVANPSAENFILLRAISQFPYLLHMAALYEKPNSYLTSHGFVLTSNSTHIQPESIKTKEAITNRINNPYRMEIKEEYRLYYDSNRKYKLDIPKVLREFGGYTTEVYYFVEFDPLTEVDLPGFYTYPQFLWRCIDSYDSETSAFISYGNYLDANRKEALPSRNGPEYTPPSSSISCSSSDSERSNSPPIRPTRRYDYLKEWRQPYTPNGDLCDPRPRPLHKRIFDRVKAQSGESDDEYFTSSDDEDLAQFDTRDYVETPFWALPYELGGNVLRAPFVAFEEICQRKQCFADYVPNFIRKFTGAVTDYHYEHIPGYTRLYNHSALTEVALSSQVSAFAQTAFMLSDSECDRIARHVTSFRTWACNRLTLLKQQVGFYSPMMCVSYCSFAITAMLAYIKYTVVKKQFLDPCKDMLFQSKFNEAEKCSVAGCKCVECENVDVDAYMSDFLFWGSDCKCYVDFCNAQSLEDQQRFVSVLAQSVTPVHLKHPLARTQMATFVQRCICDQCPLCNGEICLCKGYARARGVEVGEDDLADRAGRFAIMQERLALFADKKLQSPQERPSSARTVIRTQSPKEKPNIVKPVVRVQSPKDTPNHQKQIIRTQTAIEHEHSCKSCRRSYIHSHPLPDSGLDHRQYDLQCPYEDCKDFHMGYHNARKLQFEAISCNHGNECTCPEQFNEAVDQLHKTSYSNLDRSKFPEFVRYDEASDTSRLLWNEFDNLTHTQSQRKIEEMMNTMNLERQSHRANDQQAQDLIQNRLWPNILRLYVTQPGEDPNAIHRQLGHILALGGNLFLTNHHFMLVLALYPEADVVIRQGTIVWKRMKSAEFTKSFVRIGTKDAVVLELDYKGNAFAKVFQHFIPKSASFSHETQSVEIARYTLSRDCRMYPNPITVSGARLASTRINIDIDSRIKEVIVQPISWEYDCHTLPGDCGSPIVLLNSRIPTKIVGIHNAYSDALGTGYGVPLYSEEIRKAIETFGVKSQYGWSDLLPVEDISLLTLEDGENFRVVSVLRGSLPQPSKTKLKHSPIFGRLIETKTKPGYLRTFTNESGQEINPTLLARKKWGYHLPALDKTRVEQCDQLVSQIFSQESKRDCLEYRMPLTTEQSIVGVVGIEGLPSMNKQSSPGYPYIFTKPPGKGKTGYFGQYEWKLDTPEAKIITGAISDMEHQILEGNRPFVVSIDTLKDARIPIEKANAGKTRIFSAEPVDYCALHRKYFLPFNAHVMINRLYNFSAPGINATSPEFNQLATLLRSKGSKVVAADYSQFDGKIPTEAIRSYYLAACDWYTLNWDIIVANGRNIICDRELSCLEFTEFLMRIALECFNHVHVCEKQNDSGERFLVFYVVMNGQPSGNPGTAVSNTCAGIWIVAYCWLTDVTPQTNFYLDKFLEECYICCYGDDMIMNISDQICDVFNQHTLTDSMWRNFRLECTDEQKSTERPPAYRGLSEVTFLKRKFIWNDDICMYVGALPVDLLFDISNWVRSGAQDPYIITVDNLGSIASELALHGHGVFMDQIPKVRDAYRQVAQRAGKFCFFDSYWSYIFKYRDGESFTQAIV